MKPADTEIDPTRSHLDHGTREKAGPCPEPKSVQDNGYELDAPEGFELIEEVGRGGMGIIYRARDLAFDREVALKLLQSRYKFDSPQAIRFMDEARITGQLQHPGIPAVHRTGKMPDGKPFLVMKLIRGYTLSDLIWKSSPEPNPTDPDIAHVIPQNYLGIFESICQAIGYAHAHQVIHRDLKPQNIMVGAFGEVQVMDWGLAKVLQQGQDKPGDTGTAHADVTMIYDSKPIHSTHGTELTVAGSILGTPAYMSPEQAMGANADLDFRSDVFGLGAILCCLLTGKPPFSGDHPESTRLLSAMGMLGDTLDRLDACGAEPDLIALAKQCLSVKREDRPANGEAVAKAVAKLRAAAAERVRIAEIERTRATLHAQELKRRRHLLLWSGAIIICLLLVGIFGTTQGLLQAFSKEEEALNSAAKERQAKITETEQLRRAEDKEAETMAVLEFVDENVVSVVNRFKGAGQSQNVMLRQVLEAALGNIASKFSRQPLIEASICMTIGKSFEYLGELKTAMNLQERALALRRQHLGKQHKDTILSMLALANLQVHAEKHEEALQGRQMAYELSKEYFGLDNHITQMAMNNLASSFERFKRNEEALKLRENVLQLTKQHRGMKDSFTLLSMNNLAMSYLYSNRQTAAYKLLLEAIELQKLYLGDDHNITLNTISSLGNCLEEMQKPEEALELYQSILKTRQEKLGPDHPDTLSSVTELTLCLTKLGRFTEALKHAQSAFQNFEKRFGPDHEETLFCMTIIAGRLIDLKRGEEAMLEIEKFFQRVGVQNNYPQLLSTMFGLKFRHLLGKSDHAKCQATLAEWEKRNLTHVVSYVELAKAWSLLASLKKTTATSEADRAMEYLHKAVADKWDDVKQLETHADFNQLRNRDDYRVLLNKLKNPAQ